MYQINNEQFGKFITELRKVKNLTQKELGDKLFVSDKTVSKWERGQSFPSVNLLIPISEVLDVTVTELLKGKRLESNNLEKQEVENIIITSLGLSVKDILQRSRKKWIFAYLICIAIIISETILMFILSIEFDLIKSTLLVSGMCILFALWFIFFAKELPYYYDENKINFVSQGIFKIKMVGLAFNNNNWIYILNTLRYFLLATAIIHPFLCLLFTITNNVNIWISIQNYILLTISFILIAAIYYVGKKNEE